MEYCYFHPPGLSKIIDFSINFPWIFHVFSERLPESIFGAKSASRYRKERFWNHFRFSMAPKIRPLGPIFDQKVDFWSPCFPGGALLEPTLRPTTPPNHPRSHFYWFLSIFDGFWTDFGWFLMDFWWISDGFLKILGRFWHRFSNNFVSTFSTLLDRPPRPLNPAHPTTPQAMILNPWPGGMRVSD